LRFLEEEIKDLEEELKILKEEKRGFRKGTQRAEINITPLP